MYKIVIIAMVAMLFHGCAQKIESTKAYSVDQQKVFNLAKAMFAHDRDNEFIIDTYWDATIASKTDVMYTPFNIEVKETVYQLDANVSGEKTLFSLKIYTQVDGKKKKYIQSDSFVHQLFWSRIEYGLGYVPWVDCAQLGSDKKLFFDGIKNHRNFMCLVPPQSLKQ